MSPFAIVAILALVGYAIYKQSQRHEVVGAHRFTLAIVYVVVGLALGGLDLPNRPAEQILLLVSLLLSVGVGLARGRLTRIWRGDDGRVYAQGTALTIGLFLGMVIVKFGLGTWAYFQGLSDQGGFGEVLLMIGLMVAFQAEIVWRRGRALGARENTTSVTTA
ncbi:DUF1453 domain-containing protein [Pseudonocardia endophytica]|uniref:DUF1453 domain-containing protein n=1 Tax=Pseudonocardia endophytica TaxID=401976 RepID=A0A4R1HNX8_PSEEN|nr:DUF1453 domain-containing protein [Pseudonocardia endophytica]TCK22335.1 hypothetical protein EV378_6336 [Pseudonocardia endophytica]